MARSTVDTTRLTDRDREQVIDRLKDAYTAGTLGHKELERGVNIALTTTDTGALAAAVDDLADSSPAGVKHQAMSWRKLGAVVAAVAVLGFLGAAALGAATTDTPDQGTCISTGLSSPEVACPVPTRVQEQITQRAAVAESAATQARDLADGAPAGSPVTVAAKAAEDAAARSQQAAADAQTVMADAAGEKLAEDALNKPAKAAKNAATDAVRALHDAQAAARK